MDVDVVPLRSFTVLANPRRETLSLEGEGGNGVGLRVRTALSMAAC